MPTVIENGEGRSSASEARAIAEKEGGLALVGVGLNGPAGGVGKSV
jgi:hypothetical protein